MLSAFAAIGFTLLISSEASASTVGTRPSAPRHVVAVSGTGSATLHFLAPLSNGRLRITRYDVDARPGSRTYVCTSTNCSIHGLSSGVAYSFTVAAVNKAGRGPYSPRSNTVTVKASGPTITFNANGGIGVMANEIANTNRATFLTPDMYTYAGHAFAGWNTSANGSGTAYDNGGEYAISTSVTLYAQWSTGTVSVSFNANGGIGVMAAEAEQLNDVASLTSNSFTYSGYTFTSWNTAADGGGTSYANGGSFDFVISVTLYAQWTAAASTGPFPGSFSSNWSGYVLQGSSGGYQAVSAQWVVPTLNCATEPEGVMSIWVGVNGTDSSNPGLFQDGSSSQCTDGQEYSFVWWTDQDQGFSAQFLFNVNTGDTVFAEVAQNSSGDWVYTVKDLTTGNTSSNPEPYNGEGTSAEWIVEDPADSSTQALVPLADFNSVTMTNLGLTVPSGTWTLPPYDDALEMVDTDGKVMTLPTPIPGATSTASFTVFYESST